MTSKQGEAIDLRGWDGPSVLLEFLHRVARAKNGPSEGGLDLTILVDSREIWWTLNETAVIMGYCTSVTEEEGLFRISVETLSRRTG
jgi:hypothetical protein